MAPTINIFMNAAATQGYSHTNALQKVTMNNDEMSMATRGMTFAQPDWLPDGLNPISGGNFGGLLNLHGQYGEDGLPQAATKSWIG